MNIPPYWICETRSVGGSSFRLRGASHLSMEEARRRMDARAGLLDAFLRRGDFSQEAVSALRHSIRESQGLEAQGEYAVEVFETIVESLDAENVITRNRHGVEVLNSCSLCVLDIDSFPDTTPFFTKLLAAFGIGSHESHKTREEALRAALADLCRKQADLGIRLYRTACGWRVILQGQGLGYDSARMLGIARSLHTDELYLSLCQKQGCFRARLTPKAYRLHNAKLGPCPRRTASDTLADGETEWLAAYNKACENVAVCRLVECFGHAIDSPVLALHDSRTLALRIDRRLA